MWPKKRKILFLLHNTWKMRALINIVFALVAAARLFIVVLTSCAHPHHTAVISLIRDWIWRKHRGWRMWRIHITLTSRHIERWNKWRLRLLTGYIQAFGGGWISVWIVGRETRADCSTRTSHTHSRTNSEICILLVMIMTHSIVGEMCFWSRF